MKMMQIISGDVKQGRFADLQEWLVANEPELAQVSPPGSEYVGTFFAVYSSEKGMGQVFTVTMLDSYGAQDDLAEPGTRYSGLLNELTDFFDQTNPDRTGGILLKRVAAATLLGSEN